MSRSELRAQVAGEPPGGAKVAGRAKDTSGPKVPTTDAPAAPVPGAGQPDEPRVLPPRPRAPWLVRHPRIAIAVVLIAVTTGLAYYVYDYLRPGDPFGHFKLDPVKSAPEAAASRAAGPITPTLTPAPTPTPAPKTEPPLQPAAIAKPIPALVVVRPAAPVSTAPAASGSGITHTRSVVAAPNAPAPDARQKAAEPRASVRQEQPAPVACSEAVAALGLCDPNAKMEGK